MDQGADLQVTREGRAKGRDAMKRQGSEERARQGCGVPDGPLRLSFDFSHISIMGEFSSLLWMFPFMWKEFNRHSLLALFQVFIHFASGRE